jgi:hydroxymethylpyrimidine pyrophosphatase-like HAD family hydrolase
MNIALDYDNTYTRDPEFWRMVISAAQYRGHTVYCVTARTPNQSQEVYDSIGKVIGGDNCYFTSMGAKKDYMFSKGISIDVWIDDMPFFIENGLSIHNE